MSAITRILAPLTCCLLVTAGCAPSKPNLRQSDAAQSLVAPPPEGRYEMTGFPREAMEKSPASPGLGDAPRRVVPVSGIGCGSNNSTGPYKF